MKRYDRQGLLAIDPRALTVLLASTPAPVNELRGDVVIVDVRGPLDHHKGTDCDSYDAIAERVALACQTSAKAVVLRMDSPGGMVSGCFETARIIRATCGAAGKELIAYVDGQACSAAYALASAADRVVASDTALLGSIGVIDTRVDVSALDAAQGIKFSFIASGARKADGHPHLAFSAEELAERQSVVDHLAGVFFAHVSELRGVSTADLAALEARTLPGSAAQAFGLADEISTLDSLLAQLASPEKPLMQATKYEEARAALEEAAKGDDEEAKRAQRALAAMDEEDKPEEAESDDEPAAEGDEDKEKKKDDEPEARVSASTAAAIAASSNDLSARVAHLEHALEASERAAFLASRPDLSKDLVAVLATKPLAEVKTLVNALPKPKAPKLAATAVVAGTRGAGQGTASSTSAPELSRIDLAMGIAATSSTGVERTENTLVLGAPKARKGA